MKWTSSVLTYLLALSVLGCSDNAAIEEATRKQQQAETRVKDAEAALAEQKAVAERAAAEKSLAEAKALRAAAEAEKHAAEQLSQQPLQEVFDPVASFRQLATHTEALLEREVSVAHFIPWKDAFGKPIGKEGWSRFRFQIEQAAIDVKKSDSLVAPYTGTLTFILYTPMARNFPSKEAAAAAPNNFQPDKFPEQWTIQYVFQSPQWVPRQFLAKSAATGDWGDPTGKVAYPSLRALVESAARGN